MQDNMESSSNEYIEIDGVLYKKIQIRIMANPSDTLSKYIDDLEMDIEQLKLKIKSKEETIDKLVNYTNDLEIEKGNLLIKLKKLEYSNESVFTRNNEFNELKIKTEELQTTNKSLSNIITQLQLKIVNYESRLHDIKANNIKNQYTKENKEELAQLKMDFRVLLDTLLILKSEDPILNEFIKKYPLHGIKKNKGLVKEIVTYIKNKTSANDMHLLEKNKQSERELRLLQKNEKLKKALKNYSSLAVKNKALRYILYSNSIKQEYINSVMELYNITQLDYSEDEIDIKFIPPEILAKVQSLENELNVLKKENEFFKENYEYLSIINSQLDELVKANHEMDSIIQKQNKKLNLHEINYEQLDKDYKLLEQEFNNLYKKFTDQNLVINKLQKMVDSK